MAQDDDVTAPELPDYVLRNRAYWDEIEVQAPKGARSTQDLVDPEWARRYPAEEIWRARKR